MDVVYIAAGLAFFAALAALVVTVWSGVQYAVVAAHAMKKQNGDEA